MKRFFTILITFIACLLCLTSCDGEYDLSKDINQEINVGGEYLSLPIGSTEKIILAELLDLEDDDEFIKALADGNYSLIYKDSVEIDGLKIDGVSIPEIKPSIEAFDISKEIPPLVALPGLPDLTKRKIVLDFKIEETTADISIREKIPNEIERLVSVEMGESGAILEISTIFSLPVGIDTIVLDEFTINFPNIFMFEENLELDDDDRPVLVSNDTIVRIDGIFKFKKELCLKSFNLGEDNQNIDIEGDMQYFDLNENIKITGDIVALVYPSLLETNLTSINLNVAPSFLLNEMTFAKVEGIFNPAIDPINEAVEFEDLPEFLQGDDVYLDFINPVLKFEVSNSLDIPVITAATIVPMIAGEAQENSISATLPILRAEVLGVPTESKFWLSDSDATMPEGWMYGPADIGILLTKIPDSLSIKVDVDVDEENGLHTIDLTKEYGLKINYEINVPLALGSEFAINYTDTIKDLGKDLEDFTDKTTSLLLSIVAENSVPLNMSLVLKAVDMNFKEIEGLTVGIEGEIKAGTKDADAEGGTTSVNSDLEVELTETEVGALAKIVHLLLEIDADAGATANGASLNEKQYIKLTLSAKIPGGINIDLEE